MQQVELTVSGRAKNSVQILPIVATGPAAHLLCELGMAVIGCSGTVDLYSCSIYYMRPEADRSRWIFSVETSYNEGGHWSG